MSDVNELPAWVSILSALLTPTIAVAGIAIGFFNYRLAVRRRKDDLFDRRFAFYHRIESHWLQTLHEAPLDTEELIPVAQEAGFLFGTDISRHILSLADPPFSGHHRGHPNWPDEAFIAPFREYLTLGGRL